ncbi:MAG TPA: DUF6773 family protein [Bacillales bacterium]|nr:DUF6773 family protein [Bacillales bacterium]
MNWFIKKSVDERIEHANNKLFKEVYFLVVAICLISVVVKYIMDGFEAANVTTEWSILVLTGLYYGIRSAKLGLYSDEVEVHDRNSKLPMTAKNAVIGLGLGLFIALFIGIRNAALYADGGMQFTWYFLLVFFVCLVIYIPLFVVVMLLMHTSAYRASKKANGDRDE